jgi:hypothetical protein
MVTNLNFNRLHVNFTSYFFNLFKINPVINHFILSTSNYLEG